MPAAHTHTLALTNWGFTRNRIQCVNVCTMYVWRLCNGDKIEKEKERKKKSVTSLFRAKCVCHHLKPNGNTPFYICCYSCLFYFFFSIFEMRISNFHDVPASSEWMVCRLEVLISNVGILKNKVSTNKTLRIYISLLAVVWRALHFSETKGNNGRRIDGIRFPLVVPYAHQTKTVMHERH